MTKPELVLTDGEFDMIATAVAGAMDTLWRLNWNKITVYLSETERLLTKDIENMLEDARQVVMLYNATPLDVLDTLTSKDTDEWGKL